MLITGSLNDLNWSQIAIFAGAGILLIFIMAVVINKGKYQSRLKNFYKRMDKTISKKYDGNLLNENIITYLVNDQTNTYKSLKAKGRRKVSKYFEYYAKNLPELVLLKSFVIQDQSRSQLVILILDENDKVVYKWSKEKKAVGFMKSCNKYQMLTPLIGYLFELPLHIYEGASFRLTNHDNKYSLSYDIVKNAKRIKRKQKPVKLTKKEIKAQAKVEKVKAKKKAKH
jgi:hypothetical protein